MATQTPTSPLRIAVIGCGHGKLDAAYTAVREAAGSEGTIDVLIICGDFQAMRNTADLTMMACPLKYRNMGDFHKYYSGELQAPLLTIVIGGNHESSSYFWELYHGGWIAPNIYYLGAASVVKVGGARIGGISGIFKKSDFGKAHFERVPYRNGEEKSVYRQRRYDVFKLGRIQTQVDVMLSHDWPNGVEKYGDTEVLFRERPHFKSGSEVGTLGSPPTWKLLRRLRPRYWMAGHMHVQYKAAVNRDELPDEGGGRCPGITNQKTTFHGLGKADKDPTCLQIITVDSESRVSPEERTALTYDTEWLAIVRAMNKYPGTSFETDLKLQAFGTSEAHVLNAEIAKERNWVEQNVVNKGLLKIPHNFEITAPTNSDGVVVLREYRNPQTDAFCNLLKMENWVYREKPAKKAR